MSLSYQLSKVESTPDSEPRTQGSPSPQIPARGRAQDVSFFHPAPIYLLLRLSPGRVWMGNGGFSFYPVPICGRGVLQKPWVLTSLLLRFPARRDRLRTSGCCAVFTKCGASGAGMSLRAACHCPHPQILSPGLQILPERAVPQLFPWN